MPSNLAGPLITSSPRHPWLSTPLLGDLFVAEVYSLCISSVCLITLDFPQTERQRAALYVWVEGFGRSTREFCLETWSGGPVVSGNTRSLVEPDNSMPAVMLVDFASLDAGVMLLQIAVVAEGRLGL